MIVNFLLLMLFSSAHCVFKFTFQIDLLIKSSLRYDGSLKSDCNNSHHGRMETPDEETKIFYWLEVLWNRGFRHDNPLGTVSLLEHIV